MAENTIRVSGVKETLAALNKLDRSVGREIQKELRTAVEPVATAVRTEISRFRGASVATIKPRTRGASAFVTQNARKVTGKRGDFGRKQQLIFEQKLDEKQHQVIQGVEDALDRLTRSEGF